MEAGYKGRPPSIDASKVREIAKALNIGRASVYRALETLHYSVRRRQVLMTGDQSRALIVGDRVRWNNDINDQGTVTETTWAGVVVKWDNRGEQTILHNDMVLVERVTTKLM